MTEAAEKTTAELIEKIGRQTRRGYVDVVMETAEWQQLKSTFESQERLIEMLLRALSSVKTWAEQKCPCHNEEPNPCPLCGASVENLEACKAVDNTFPRHIREEIDRALAAAKRA